MADILDKEIHKLIFGKDIDIPPNYRDNWVSCGFIFDKLFKQHDFASINFTEDPMTGLWECEIQCCTDYARFVYAISDSDPRLALIYTAIKYFEDKVKQNKEKN